MGAPARMLVLAAGAVAAMLVVGGLAGCTPGDPKPTRSPTASHTPLFASDEEALKAATDAYAAYLKMSDTIAHDGGNDPERYRKVAFGRALQDAIDSAKEYKVAGLHSTGNTSFDSVRLQSARLSGVTIYVCDDVKHVDVLDASGKSHVEPNRDPRTPFEVSVARNDQGSILVERRTLWQGVDFC